MSSSQEAQTPVLSATRIIQSATNEYATDNTKISDINASMAQDASKTASQHLVKNSVSPRATSKQALEELKQSRPTSQHTIKDSNDLKSSSQQIIDNPTVSSKTISQQQLDLSASSRSTSQKELEESRQSLQQNPLNTSSQQAIENPPPPSKTVSQQLYATGIATKTDDTNIATTDQDASSNSSHSSSSSSESLSTENERAVPNPNPKVALSTTSSDNSSDESCSTCDSSMGTSNSSFSGTQSDLHSGSSTSGAYTSSASEAKDSVPESQFVPLKSQSAVKLAGSLPALSNSKRNLVTSSQKLSGSTSDIGKITAGSKHSMAISKDRIAAFSESKNEVTREAIVESKPSSMKALQSPTMANEEDKPRVEKGSMHGSLSALQKPMAAPEKLLLNQTSSPRQSSSKLLIESDTVHTAVLSTSRRDSNQNITKTHTTQNSTHSVHNSSTLLGKTDIKSMADSLRSKSASQHGSFKSLNKLAATSAASLDTPSITPEQSAAPDGSERFEVATTEDFSVVESRTAKTDASHESLRHEIDAKRNNHAEDGSTAQSDDENSENINEDFWQDNTSIQSGSTRSEPADFWED
jgi:hypothetical protein